MSDDTADDIAAWMQREIDGLRRNIPDPVLTDHLAEDSEGGMEIVSRDDLPVEAWVWFYAGKLAAFTESRAVLRNRFDLGEHGGPR
jgi:hypothetical protein